MRKVSFVNSSGNKCYDDYHFYKTDEIIKKLEIIHNDIIQDTEHTYIRIFLGCHILRFPYYYDYKTIQNTLYDSEENILIIIDIIDLSNLTHFSSSAIQHIIKNPYEDVFEDDSIIKYAKELYDMIWDDDIIKEIAILKYSVFLKYAETNIRDDHNIAFRCIIKNNSSYNFISNRLKNNYDFIKKIIIKSPIIQTYK